MKKTALLNFNVDKEARQIKVQRSFDASLTDVWSAWTQFELLDKWWAPAPWKARTKEMDFVKGGHWLYEMIGPDNTGHWARMDFISIEKKKFFSAYESFCDSKGVVDDQLPRSKWENQFSSQAKGSTLVNITISFSSLSDLEALTAMGFEEGFTDAMDNLDRQLGEGMELSNQEQVKKVIDDWCQAIRDINYENLLSAHTEDILMFDVPPPLQNKGLGEYKKTWDLFYQYSSGGKGSFELEELQITAGEDVAFCTALLAIGNGRKPECRLTVGLKKIEGRWLIAHEHHSAPAPIS